MSSIVILIAAIAAGVLSGAAIGISAGKVAAQMIESRSAAVVTAVVATAVIYTFIGPIPVAIAMFVAAMAIEILLTPAGAEGAWTWSLSTWISAWSVGIIVAVLLAAIYALKPPPPRRTM